MFTKLIVERFRGIWKLNVEPLDRVNLFLGKNNIGKTALLEAIFLLAGPTNPELPIRFNVFRGIDSMRNVPEELWGWLFYKKDLDSKIHLRAELGVRKYREVTISLKVRREIVGERTDKPKLTAAKRGFTDTGSAARPSELNIVYADQSPKRIVTRAFVKEDGIGFDRTTPFGFPDSIFVPARQSYHVDNAERFSRLAETGEEEGILPALRLLEPRLRRLSVLLTGGVGMLHGDIGIGRLVPLPMMGEGITRLTTLLLAVSQAKGGIVAIDEIDTGFHYSVLPQVWASIAEAARVADVQVFATTHSFECLKAAHESFSGSESYDFQLHRLDRDEDGVVSTAYDREMIETALLTGLEMRG